MKNSKLDLQQLKAKELTKSQMKQIMGGLIAGPCDSCRQLCHESNGGTRDAEYGFGMCSPETGGTSCHNYCCEAGQPTYWC